MIALIAMQSYHMLSPGQHAMASITIRQLDDDLKKRLRLRAARNGRSMEDEARTILRGAAAGEDAESGVTVRQRHHPSGDAAAQLPARSPSGDPRPGTRRVL